MKKFLIIILSLLTFTNILAQPSKGYQFNYIPNLNQYDHCGFYINANKIIVGGSVGGFPSGGTIMSTDTSGVIGSSWSFTEANGITPMRVRMLDANNTIVCGKNYLFPQSAYISIFNNTTGTFSSAYYYNHSGLGFGSGQMTASDAIKLASGDLAMTGNVNETLPSTPAVNNLGTCGSAVNGYGFLAGSWGTNNYNRADDIYLIRAGANGDTASSASGFFKKYSLAYCGGPYTPPVPETPGHTTGNFCYQFMPSWMADSTRSDVGVSLLEVSGNIFICGYTQDFNAVSTGTQRDLEAFILKVNLTGNVQWVRTYYLRSGTTPWEYGIAMESVTSDASNDIIMTMRSEQSGNVELIRVANATGNIVWAKSYDFGAYDRPWGIKKTASNTFVVAVTSTVNVLGGGYDMALLEIDANGAVIRSKGYGTSNMDGTDSWAWNGPDVDVFSVGNYALGGITNYSGGSTGGSLIVKANRSGNTSGCTSNQFTTTVTVSDRNVGGANQLVSRKPLVYETKGGGTKGVLTITPTVITPSVTSTKICILPIELLSFSAEQSGKEVQLNWVTASETNNDFFTIERSSDAVKFEPILKVNGAGTSTNKNSYVNFDVNPLKGVSYYRLKQTDFDGAFAYSSTIPVTYKASESFNVSYDNSSNDFIVSFRSETYSDYNIIITNDEGMVVRKDNIGYISGGYERYYDLSSYGVGIYFITLNCFEGSFSKQVLVH